MSKCNELLYESYGLKSYELLRKMYEFKAIQGEHITHKNRGVLNFIPELAFIFLFNFLLGKSQHY